MKNPIEKTVQKSDEHKTVKKQLGGISAYAVGVIVFQLVWVLILIQHSLTSFIFGYFFPFYLTTISAGARAYLEHRNINDANSPHVYDTKANLIERLSISGGFFNYHALHHIFPSVPQHYLPDIQNKIEQLGLNPYDGLEHIRVRDSYFSSEA